MEEERPHEQIAVYKLHVGEHKWIYISVEKFSKTDYKIYVQGVTDKRGTKIEFTLVYNPGLKDINVVDIETTMIEQAEKAYKTFQEHHVSWRI